MRRAAPSAAFAPWPLADCTPSVRAASKTLPPRARTNERLRPRLCSLAGWLHRHPPAFHRRPCRQAGTTMCGGPPLAPASVQFVISAPLSTQTSSNSFSFHHRPRASAALLAPEGSPILRRQAGGRQAGARNGDTVVSRRAMRIGRRAGAQDGSGEGCAAPEARRTRAQVQTNARGVAKAGP